MTRRFLVDQPSAGELTSAYTVGGLVISCVDASEANGEFLSVGP